MSTLAERVRKWGDELNQEWLEKGIRRGMEQGIRKGLEEGTRKGRQEAERELLCQLAARRFGHGTAEQLIPFLEDLSNRGRIAAVANGIVECETGEELIVRAREA